MVVAMSQLSDRLDEARGDLGLDRVVELIRKAGYGTSRATVNRLLNGSHGPKVEDTSLQAMAAALNLDVRELRELASRPPGELEPFEPVQEANLLTQRQRYAVNELIKAIVEGGTGSDSGQDEAQKTPVGEATTGEVAPVVDLQRAARTGPKLRPDQEHPDDDM